MKILVTGGAGFIGSHQVDELVAKGFLVCILDNLIRGRKEFIDTHFSRQQIEFIQGDVRDIDIDFIWIGQVVQALVAAGLSADWPVKQPVNVGSGVGTSIRELAEKVLQVSQTRVKIKVVAPRAPEVIRFVADTSRLSTLTHLSCSTDPLMRLPTVVNYWRTCMDPGCKQ